MDIKHLKYFVEVARQKSFSKAASVNFVSQSTVSKMIKDLETELGVGLLKRNSKYVDLTDAGGLFFLQAEKTVEMFDHIIESFQDSLTYGQGKIAIGLPPITAATEFAGLLGRFGKAFPQIEMTLFEYGSKKVELGIQDGSLDVGVVCSPTINELYERIPFSKDPLQVIVHNSHPLSAKTAIGFAELSEESFVLYRTDFSLYDEIIHRCRSAGFAPHIILETSQRELMTQIVAANLGVTLLPSKICSTLNNANISAVDLTAPVCLEMSIIWHRRRLLSPAARRWINFVQDYLVQAF